MECFDCTVTSFGIPEIVGRGIWIRNIVSIP